MCQLLVEWPSQNTLDLLLHREADRIGKTFPFPTLRENFRSAFSPVRFTCSTDITFPFPCRQLRYLVASSTFLILPSLEPVQARRRSISFQSR